MKGSIFVLSGEELTLPQAEIRALVEAYSPLDTVQALGSRVVFSSIDDVKIADRISRRAAYCRFGGKIIGSSDRAKDLTDSLTSDIMVTGKTFVVGSESLGRETVGEIGAELKRITAAKVSMEEPDYVFQAEKIDRGFALGVSTCGFKKFSWRVRRPRARKFFLPSAIYPKLACLLVNLSRVKEGDLFLDPFCGTGSLLIESSLMGMRTVGSDLTGWIARGALLNLRGLSLDYEGIIRCDATHSNFPLGSVDGITTDVPYGRASSTRGKDTARIIREFTHSAANILTKNHSTYCVVMHPSHVEFDFDSEEFLLVERHFIYVHRNLTRAVSVLRSKRSN
jgi:tRNA (guanine10-N2)-dimethyltransferase